MNEINFHQLGRFIIIIGIILVVFGIFLMYIKNIPFIGKLPGDIFIQKKNFSFYFPIASSILISIIISLILYLIMKRR
jgi:hypothetical protein